MAPRALDKSWIPAFAGMHLGTKKQERVMKIIFILGFLIVLSVVGFGAEVDLGTHGILSFAVPDTWTVNSNPAKSPMDRRSGLRSLSNPAARQTPSACSRLLTSRAQTWTRKRIRQEVLRMTEEFAAQSVEKKANLKDFALKQGHGAYCLFTDASLVGKEPREMITR